MTNTHDLKQKFWKTLADSPFVFLQLDSDPHGAVPMTAQLDPDADGRIWFFTSRNHDFAKGGPATASFSGKGHDLFARFTGTLSEEYSKERLAQLWSPAVEAWYPEGKADPNILLLKMDLRQAEIWNSELGLLDAAKTLLGFDAREQAEKEHATALL